MSTFTLDGFVAGTWGVQRERGAATLTIKHLAPLSKADAAALADEGAGLLAFLAADATDHDIRFADAPNVTERKPSAPGPGSCTVGYVDVTIRER